MLKLLFEEEQHRSKADYCLPQCSSRFEATKAESTKGFREVSPFTYLVSRVRNSIGQVNTQALRRISSLPANKIGRKEELACAARDAIPELKLRPRSGDAVCGGEAFNRGSAIGAKGELIRSAIAVSNFGKCPDLARSGIAARGDENRRAVRRRVCAHTEGSCN
jgi:hypothetical protein